MLSQACRGGETGVQSCGSEFEGHFSLLGCGCYILEQVVGPAHSLSYRHGAVSLGFLGLEQYLNSV